MKRKRIAAATVLMVSVIGLGLAGYIGATSASGMDILTGEGHGSGFHRYRLNHQTGIGGSAYTWGRHSNEYASNVQDESLRLARNAGPGSAEPEGADDSDAANAGTSRAYGAGLDSHEQGHTPAGGASGSNGENWAPSTFRLAGSYGPGYRSGSGGGSGGGGSQGAVNEPPSNTNESQQPVTDGPDQEHPPTTPTDKPDEPKNPLTPDEPTDPTNPDTPGGDEDQPVSVPEPATLGLLGFGLAALGYMRRRRTTV